jgi:hypothetical protein
MFGLFGKDNFETEMSILEKQHKAVAAELVNAMQRIDIRAQLNAMDSLLSIYDKKIECCKKHNKIELLTSLEAERSRLNQLRG